MFLRYAKGTMLPITIVGIACISAARAVRAATPTDDTSTKIDNLEKEIAGLSRAVCGVTSPTDPDEKALFDARKALLTQAAKDLVKLLDQQKSELDKTELPSSQKSALKQSIDDEEKSLQGDCPVLTPAVQKAATSAGAAAQPSTSVSDKSKLSVSPSQIDFGHQTMQTESGPKTVTITNTSGGDLDLAPLSLPNASRNFRISNSTCNNKLSDKATCTFDITYVPFSETNEDSFVSIVPGSSRDAYDKLVSNLNEKKLQAAQDQIQVEHDKSDKEKLSASKQKLLASQNEVQKASDLLKTSFNSVALSGTADHWKYPLTRAVVGVDLSAPTSRTIKQAYFIDFDLLAPLRPLSAFKKNEDPLENNWWVWLNPRITSLPQATKFSALSTINETGSFFSDMINQGKLNDLVQGLDVNGGLEFAVIKPRDGIPWWAEYPNTRARLTPSLIVGGGVSTPFSGDITDVSAQVNQGICDAFAAPAGTTRSSPQGLVCMNTGPTGNPANTTMLVAPDGSLKPYVTFFTPARSRFFRRAYAGVRLKTYYFSKVIRADCNPPVKRSSGTGGCEAPYDVFPGIVDLTFGKDEAVTGGRLTRWLLRLEAVYPLPFNQGIHIFGSIYTALLPNSRSAPFNAYTVTMPAQGANNDFNTFRFGLNPLSRDYFRVGVGVDLIQVFKKASKGGQPNAAAPSTPQSQQASQPASTTPPAQGDQGTKKPAPRTETKSVPASQSSTPPVNN